MTALWTDLMRWLDKLCDTMKTIVSVLALLASSVSYGQIVSWVNSGFNEIATGRPWSSVTRQWLWTDRMVQQDWTFIPPVTQVEIINYTNYAQTIWATQSVCVSWTNGSGPITNFSNGYRQGRWFTGGSVGCRFGTNIFNQPYRQMAWAAIAVFWPTNSEFQWRCWNYSDNAKGVLLYRTNGTTVLLTALASWGLNPGERITVTVPPVPDNWWNFMTIASCIQCSDGPCELAYQVPDFAPNARVEIQNGVPQLVVNSLPSLRVNSSVLTATNGVVLFKVIVEPPTPEASFEEFAPGL